MNIDIQLARPGDFDHIAQMVYNFFQEEKQKDGRTVVTNWEKIIPTVLSRLRDKQHNFKYYSISTNGSVIGVINLLFPVSDKNRELGEILMWYVEPEYRDVDGKLEHQVVQWAIKILSDLSAKTIRTDVLLTDQRTLNIILQSKFKPFTGVFTLEL